MTVDQVLRRDGAIYPKGQQFTGFLAWMEEGRKRFVEEHPEHTIRGALSTTITSQTAFTKFLQTAVEDYLGV
jgi:hypothetical protein